MSKRAVFNTLMCCLIAWIVSLPATATADSQQKSSIAWQVGPTKGDLGGLATIDVPEGYRFAGKEGAQKVLELTQNPVSGKEVGVLMPVYKEGDKSNAWVIYFEFDDVGYVKDDEKDKLDVDAILQSLKEGTEEGNKYRREKGWPDFHVTGWYKPPFYDLNTHNLTWAVVGKTSGNDTDQTVNYSTRILGRRGTMNVDLVLDANQVTDVVPEFDKLMGQFSYNPGGRYAEFTRGDKVAEYGLAALIAGGAGAALIKTGLLAKFWKLIVVGFAALMGAIKKGWNKLKSVFSKEETIQSSPQP
jgi:uncharacterized membrane-anchored protein